MWYGSHHYSYSMGFFPPIFYPLRIVLSFPISSSVCPRCYLSSCLLSSLSLGAPERSLYISTHCLHVAYWCTRARESACMADVRRCLLCVRHRQIGRGNAMLHVLLALCKCMQEREGGGGANLVGEGEWAEREVVYDTRHKTLLRGRGKDWSCLLWGKNTLRSILTDYSFLL